MSRLPLHSLKVTLLIAMLLINLAILGMTVSAFLVACNALDKELAAYRRGFKHCTVELHESLARCHYWAREHIEEFKQ